MLLTPYAMMDIITKIANTSVSRNSHVMLKNSAARIYSQPLLLKKEQHRSIIPQTGTACSRTAYERGTAG
jgi:hypothetical protein